jgi:hypothetical protein
VARLLFTLAMIQVLTEGAMIQVLTGGPRSNDTSPITRGVMMQQQTMRHIKTVGLEGAS